MKHSFVIDGEHRNTHEKTMSNQEQRELMGGKAASLWQLSQWGLPVPEFCCITSESFKAVLKTNQLDSVTEWLQQPSQSLPLAFDSIRATLLSCIIPEQIDQSVDNFISRHPESYFAVRSSGTLEDGDEASFAGLYQTVLNVKNREDIFNAVRSCWAALFDERVRVYLHERKMTQPMGLALVIQKLAPAEKSGVLFTVDPLSGTDTEVLIEASFGLGEALVSGQVTPDQYRYDWYQEQEIARVIADKEVQCVRIDSAPFTQFKSLDEKKSKQPVLQQAEVRELISLALVIQEKTGYPVDIEWAKAGDGFCILQSRPITRLGYAGIPGEWTTADFRDGGVSATVCTPYMASLYKSVLDVTMTNYIKRLGLSKNETADPWQRSFYSRPYWNLKAVKGYLSNIPGFNERAFDEGLGITPNYVGDGLVAKTTTATIVAGLRALYAIKRSGRRKLQACPSFSVRQKMRLEELRRLDLAALDTQSLYLFCENFLTQEYYENESTYFDFIYDNSNINALFKDSITKLAFDMTEFPLLLSGLSGVSHLAQIERMWELREVIQTCAAAMRYWQSNTAADIAAEFQAGSRDHQLDKLAIYLEEFGHHAKHELDLMVPRYCEDPAYVITQLQEILIQTAENDPRERNRKQKLRAAATREKLLQAAPIWRRALLSSSLRQVRKFLWWREELRDLSTKFYYFVRKITLEVERRLLTAGTLQEKGDIFFLEKDDLIALMRGTLVNERCREIVQRNKLYYASFSRFVAPDEIGERYGCLSGLSLAEPPTEKNMNVAGSPGVATGTARVIAGIDDAHRLRPGDILVTRCTDPAWTAKFSQLNGVVTETGGILSHAAVICREYGIPAILAVKKATSLIKEGETITINGSSGKIFLGNDVALESRIQNRPQGTLQEAAV